MALIGRNGARRGGRDRLDYVTCTEKSLTIMVGDTDGPCDPEPGHGRRPILGSRVGGASRPLTGGGWRC